MEETNSKDAYLCDGYQLFMKRWFPTWQNQKTADSSFSNKSNCLNKSVTPGVKFEEQKKPLNLEDLPDINVQNKVSSQDDTVYIGVSYENFESSNTIVFSDGTVVTKTILKRFPSPSGKPQHLVLFEAEISIKENPTIQNREISSGPRISAYPTLEAKKADNPELNPAPWKQAVVEPSSKRRKTNISRKKCSKTEKETNGTHSLTLNGNIKLKKTDKTKHRAQNIPISIDKNSRSSMPQSYMPVQRIQNNFSFPTVVMNLEKLQTTSVWVDNVQQVNEDVDLSSSLADPVTTTVKEVAAANTDTSLYDPISYSYTPNAPLMETNKSAHNEVAATKADTSVYDPISYSYTSNVPVMESKVTQGSSTNDNVRGIFREESQPGDVQEKKYPCPFCEHISVGRSSMCNHFKDVHAEFWNVIKGTSLVTGNGPN